MATTKGAQAVRGEPGERGEQGERGERGEQGERGERGERGEKGALGGKGQRGIKGERGPAGPAATRTQILTAVQDEFDGIRKELRIQLERMAQIQRQLDVIEHTLSTMLGKGG